MRYKDTEGKLLKEGIIKKCPVDFKAAEIFIRNISTMIKSRHPQREFSF